MTKGKKGLAAVVLSGAMVAASLAGILTIKSAPAFAEGEDAVVNPISLYKLQAELGEDGEIVDKNSVLKDEMGNYPLSFRNEWMAGGTGPLFDEFTPIEGGGVTFDKKFCVAQDIATGFFQTSKAFTLCIELKPDSAHSKAWNQYAGIGHYAWEGNYIGVGAAADLSDNVGLTYSPNKTGYWDQVWLTEGESGAWRKIIVSVQPGNRITSWVDGVKITNGTMNGDKDLTLIPEDWNLAGGCSFAIGAGFNGCAGYSTSGSIKNVAIYDFAMDATAAAAYQANDRLTESDTSGVRRLTGAEVTENPATGALSDTMTLDEMKASLSASAQATLTFTNNTADPVTLKRTVTWSQVVKEGNDYFAVGSVDVSSVPFLHAAGVGNTVEVRYQLSVLSATFGDITFDSQPALNDNMTTSEMLAAIAGAYVPVTLEGNTENCTISWTEVVRGTDKYTASGSYEYNGANFPVTYVLPVTKVAGGYLTEIQPLALYEFKDANDIGKDTMGNYDMSIRNRYDGNAPGSAGALMNEFTLLEGGGVSFDRNFCIAQDLDKNMFKDVSAFTIAFEIKTVESGKSWGHILGTGSSSSKSFGVREASGNKDQAVLSASNCWTLNTDNKEWDSFWFHDCSAWGTASATFQKVIISAQPGGDLNVYINGVKADKSGRVPVSLPSDWNIYDPNVSFSIGARFNGNADEPSTSSLKYVAIYDFAMNEQCAQAYYNNAMLVRGDFTETNSPYMTGMSFDTANPAAAFKDGKITPKKLNTMQTLTEAYVFSQLNPATADVALSTGATGKANIVWKRVEKVGNDFVAVGGVTANAAGYAKIGKIDDLEVRVTVPVYDITIGQLQYEGDKIYSGELNHASQNTVIPSLKTVTASIAIEGKEPETATVVWKRVVKETKEGEACLVAYGELMWDDTKVQDVSFIVEKVADLTHNWEMNAKLVTWTQENGVVTAVKGMAICNGLCGTEEEVTGTFELKSGSCVAPTCSASGKNVYTVTFNCHGTPYTFDSAEFTVPKIAHSFGEWTQTKEPTLTQAGEEKRTCSVCGEEETRPVPALGDSEAVKAFKNAVGAIPASGTLEAKLTAISAAFEKYAQLDETEKSVVAAEYATLEEAVASYNAKAELANGEYASALDIAVRTITSTLVTVSALAAVWFILKKTL